MAHSTFLIGAVLFGLLSQAAAADPQQGGAPVTPNPAPGGLLELPLSSGAPTPAPVPPQPAVTLPTIVTPPPAPPSVPETLPVMKPGSKLPGFQPLPPAVPASSPATPPIIAPNQSGTAALKPTAAIPLAPAPAAPPPESDKALEDIAAKSPDILVKPPHLGNTSLMFSKSEMSIILEALEVYDGSARAKHTDTSATKDDLSSLLDSLKSHNEGEPNVTPTALPHLYLGSIVFYSPSHWSVWINGKMLISKKNVPSAELYVTRLSHSEIEVVWRPFSLLDTPSLWQKLTHNGAQPLHNISVDESKGTITLRLHPNQTFLPRSLTIREGLIKGIPSPTPPLRRRHPGPENPWTEAMTAPPLEITGISKRYGDHQVLDNVSLSLHTGELFGLIGLNGVGKTTLIKTILDLTRPDKGSARLFGEDCANARARRHISYLPEKFQPSRYLRGREYLSLALSYFGRAFDPERAKAEASLLDLQPDKLENKVGSYSKGMGQKLGLIGAFLVDAPFLILDEPMSGLDPKARIMLKEKLLACKAQGKTIFFSSHILSDIDEICDRIGVISDSRMIFLGTPQEFKRVHPGETLEKSFLRAIA